MIYKVLSVEPIGKLINSLGQLESMKNKKIYVVKNSFVDDVISDIESMKSMESSGYGKKNYFIATFYKGSAFSFK